MTKKTTSALIVIPLTPPPIAYVVRLICLILKTHGEEAAMFVVHQLLKEIPDDDEGDAEKALSSD